MKNVNTTIVSFWKNKLSPYIALENSSVLEIGCGDGTFGKILARNLFKEYCGLDPDESSILKARTEAPANAKFVIGRAEEIPINKKFEVILFTFSWHFISDFEKVLRELKRLIANEGIIVIIEPNVHNTLWKDSRLNQQSDNFSEELLEKKILFLKKSRTKIENQRGFEIIKSEIGDEDKPDIWILKPKN